MANNANHYAFENSLNNRISTINNNILNHRFPCVGIANQVYLNEDGNLSIVPLIMPDNWANVYENDRNNNFNTIRVCYIYFLTNYYRDLNRTVQYLDNLHNIGAENIDVFANEINNAYNTINVITNCILEIGNIYLGIMLREE